MLSRTIISLGSDAEVSDRRGAGRGPAALRAGRDRRPGLLRRHDRGQARRRLVALVRRPAGPSASGRSPSSTARPCSVGASTVRWALAQLGSRVVRSRIDNLLEGDGSSVEQVEIVFGSADQLFDLTSYTRHTGRDTTGNLLTQGRPGRALEGLHEGPGDDRPHGPRHGQLPGRVRDAALATGALGRDPQPGDRPARLPARRPRQLRRPDRRDPALLPGEPRHRARTKPASSSSSATWSRSWRACRWRRPRTGCAICSRRSGMPGAAPGPQRSPPRWPDGRRDLARPSIAVASTSARPTTSRPAR